MCALLFSVSSLSPENKLGDLLDELKNSGLQKKQSEAIESISSHLFGSQHLTSSTWLTHLEIGTSRRKGGTVRITKGAGNENCKRKRRGFKYHAIRKGIMKMFFS